jgi:hypothetical protein
MRLWALLTEELVEIIEKESAAIQSLAVVSTALNDSENQRRGTRCLRPVESIILAIDVVDYLTDRSQSTIA